MNLRFIRTMAFLPEKLEGEEFYVDKPVYGINGVMVLYLYFVEKDGQMKAVRMLPFAD